MLHIVRAPLCLSGSVHDVFADPHTNKALREGERDASASPRQQGGDVLPSCSSVGCHAQGSIPIILYNAPLDICKFGEIYREVLLI